MPALSHMSESIGRDRVKSLGGVGVNQMTGQPSRFGWLSTNTLVTPRARQAYSLTSRRDALSQPAGITYANAARQRQHRPSGRRGSGHPEHCAGFSGRRSDKLQRGKSIALIGYLLTAIAKPLTGFATVWQTALVDRLLDRFGAGFRSAPRDGLIASSVAKKIEERPLASKNGRQPRRVRSGRTPCAL